MPQGLEIFNDHGVYQIDGQTPNLVFLQKGAATDSVTFNSPAYPIVFIRPTRGHRIFLRHNGGVSYTYFCRGAFDYWVFTRMLDASVQSFGLQVFSETGELVYGSNTKPLIIDRAIQYQRLAANNPGSGSPTFRVVADYSNLLPNSNYAFSPSIGAGYWLERPYGASSWLYTPVVESIEATARGFRIREVQPFVGFTAGGGGAGVPIDWTAPPGTVVIADVSGL